MKDYNNFMDNSQLFTNKYQPIYFDDYDIDDDIIKVLKQLISLDTTNFI